MDDGSKAGEMAWRNSGRFLVNNQHCFQNSAAPSPRIPARKRAKIHIVHHTSYITNGLCYISRR